MSQSFVHIGQKMFILKPSQVTMVMTFWKLLRAHDTGPATQLNLLCDIKQKRKPLCENYVRI